MRAYFTVEAACVLPIVLGVYLFLIYGMFYQYDRCLLEQDTALMAMEYESFPKGRETERYLAWQQEGMDIRIDEGRVQVKCEGRMVIPFTGLEKWTREKDLKISAVYTRREIRPTDWIRIFRRLMEE